VPVGRIVTTDSVAPQSGLPLPIEVVPIAPMLAEVITRLDQHRSLGALISDQ
jgi:phosphoribosylpyrophosphate synthetase